MVAAARGSMTALPAQTGSAYSVSRGGTISVSLTGLDQVSPACVMFGVTNPGPPATYSDMAGGGGQDVAGGEWDSAQLAFNPDTGLWTATIRTKLGAASGSVGDAWWIAVFLTVASLPGPTDVPDFTFGPFVAIP